MKNRFIIKIAIVACISIILNMNFIIYANNILSDNSLSTELKNNYITFDKIDSTGVTDNIRNHMKVMWDSIDIYIDYLNAIKLDTFENSVLQLKIVVDTVGTCFQQATAIANRFELSYIIIVIENIKNKLSLNNLDNLRNILFNS